MKRKEINFIAWIDHYLDSDDRSVTPKTQYNYRCAQHVLAEYLHTLHRTDLPLSQLNCSFLKDFQQWLLLGSRTRRPICPNTLSAYFRSLRSLLHKAQEQYQLPLTNPFPRHSTGNHATAKRAVEATVIHALLNLNLSKVTHLREACDFFLLSYFLCGMPFVDMAKLHKGCIQGQVLQYSRSKTGTDISIPMNACIRTFLDRYEGKGKGLWLLPILSKPTFDQRDYNVQLRKYNRHLKRLEQLLGQQFPELDKIRLTSYVARHSWATEALTKKG